MNRSLAVRNGARLSALALAVAAPPVVGRFHPGALGEALAAAAALAVVVIGQWLWRLTQVAGLIKAEGEKHFADLETLKSLLGAERRNLGQVADAVNALRSALEQERSNLSEVANAVAELRDEVNSAAKRMEAQGEGVAVLRETINSERKNLGLVAGGLDSLRRVVVDAETVVAHNAAVSDCLLLLAKRMDDLSASSGEGEAPHRTQKADGHA